MAMRDRSAFDVDHVLGQAEFIHHRHRDGGEGLVDLDPLDVGDLPPGPFQRLADRGHGAKAEQAGLDARDAVTDELAEGFKAVPVCELALGHHHRRRAAVEAGGVAGRNRAVLSEAGLSRDRV